MVRTAGVQRPSFLVRWGLLILMLSSSGLAQSKDLGNGFRDHGVAAPISAHRGTVAAVDGNGRNVAMLSSNNKLYSHYRSHFVEFDLAKRAFTL